MSGICKKCYRIGYDDKQIGQPCESCKDGVIERDPPWQELVEVLPEPMTCGRRSLDQFAPGFPAHKGHDQQGQDRWHRHKSNGDRVCSFCGSMHPEDFWRLVKVAAEAPEDADYRKTVHVHASDKGYKIYVDQPGVHNTGEGAIKFYRQHIPRDADGKMIVTPEQEKLYIDAVNRSHARFERYLDEQYPHRKGPQIIQ